MKFSKRTRLWSSLQMVNVANILCARKMKAPHDRNAKEEFEPAPKLVSEAIIRAIKEMISALCWDFRGSFSLEPLEKLNCLVGEAILKSEGFAKDEMTRDQRQEHDMKVARLLASQVQGAVFIATNEFDEKRTTHFFEMAQLMNKDVFEQMFARSLYVKAKNSDFKIASNDKFTQKELDAEIIRLSDCVYHEDHDVRPQLTAEAFRMIASSVAAMDDAADAEKANQFKDLSKDERRNSKELGAIVGKRVDRLIDKNQALADDLKKLCQELPIGNPEDVAKHVLDDLVEKISEAMTEVALGRGKF